jgi:serine/threonine-protein kinase
LSIAGRYRLTSRLDRGGLAEVWEAEDTELDRPVAVKILHTRPDVTPSLAEAFHAEAQVEAALTHPNIDEVYDGGHDGSLTYVVTELLSGRTLREMLDLEGVFSWQATASVGRQIGEALAYAHALGYAHGTLSPERIMFSPDGHATALAFGVACRGLCEKPPAPDLDTRALGGVMYEMLTGSSPFDARPAEQPDHEPWPRAVRAAAPATPAELEHIVMRAISPDPRERYSTAAELVADLDRFLAPPDRRWIWWTAAVLAVVAAALATWFFTSARTVVIPDVTGKTTAEASAILGKAGLKLVVTGQAASSAVPTAAVVAENPAAGQNVRRGARSG